jgi:hypothetical protein
MTPPSADKIAAALEALRTDARAWAAAADEMSAAEQTARRLSLDAFHFTYIGDQIGITEVYRNLQDKLVTLLGQAAANFDSMALALRMSADTYQSEDEAGVHRMRNIY